MRTELYQTKPSAGRCSCLDSVDPLALSKLTPRRVYNQSRLKSRDLQWLQCWGWDLSCPFCLLSRDDHCSKVQSKKLSQYINTIIPTVLARQHSAETVLTDWKKMTRRKEEISKDIFFWSCRRSEVQPVKLQMQLTSYLLWSRSNLKVNCSLRLIYLASLQLCFSHFSSL